VTKDEAQRRRWTFREAVKIWFRRSGKRGSRDPICCFKNPCERGHSLSGRNINFDTMRVEQALQRVQKLEELEPRN